MIIYRIRWRSRAIVLLTLGVVGLGVLFLQKYAFSLLTSRQSALHRKVQHLREEAAQPHPDQVKSFDTESHSGTKVILMHSFPTWYELKSGHQHFSNCNRSCSLTLDSELVTEVDAVIFFVRHFKSQLRPGYAPNQIWIYFQVESPFNSDSDVFGKPEWHHRFNWTMTYRRDSDFYFGYGDMVKPSVPLHARSFTSVVQNKSKMVAWFVSNCHTQSKREDLVSVLKEFVQVDMYGSCGDRECGKEGNQTCLDMLSRDYYFYLAFENSMCKDYITEKLYHTMKQADVVPVVRGGANYSALLPSNSFIDASQFPSVKALADHLKKVSGDRKLYEQHLAWKNSLQVIEPMPFSFCDVCYRLHHSDRWAHVYPNVETWWTKDACFEPPPVVKS